MTSSPHAPYAQGCTHATMGSHKGMQDREVEPIPENYPQFRSESATRLREVGIASNRRSAHCGEYVPGACTHRPSSDESRLHPKSLAQPVRERGAQGAVGDWR